MDSLASIRVGVACGALALGLLAASTPGHAAEFDPQLRSPGLVTQNQVRTRLREYVERASTMPLVDRLREGGTADPWIDVKWQLNRMAQAGQELPELSEFGIAKQSDGSYVIDVAQNPQWEMWDLKLSLLEDPEIFELHARRLLDRGFREQDIQILQEYVEQNHPQRVVFDAERALLRAVATQRSRLPRLKQPLGVVDAASYVYQLDRAREEAKQQWAAGLLERLDEQRRRILASFYQELGGTIVFVPDSDFDRSIRHFAEEMTSGVYEQQLLQREQELRQ